MNYYLLNIGNTNTQVAVSQNDTVALLAQYDTASLFESPSMSLLKCGESFPILALCMVPRIQTALQQQYGSRIHFLTHRNFSILDFSNVNTGTLGLDRISNAAFAFHTLHAPVMVKDLGTCISTVIVDGYGGFLGGTITPGRMLQRLALHEHTGQLPLVPMTSASPPVIGTHTQDAIRAGVDRAILGTARELIIATRCALPQLSTVWATGGDAAFFLEHIPELTPAPELMTLRGILCANL